MRIVLVEDDVLLQEFLKTYLEHEGFDIYTAYTGIAGLRLLREKRPDLMIVDIGLPDIDGWEVCKRIRSVSSVPIIILSATATEDDDIIRGLIIGADEFLLKPVRPRVLNARINALLRRSNNTQWSQNRHSYVDAHLSIDLARQQVQIGGQHQSLTTLEYALLQLLVVNAGQTVPMPEIVDELWTASRMGVDTYARYVRIYIQRLREIIEPDPQKPRYILTDHGLGYRFTPHS